MAGTDGTAEDYSSSSDGTDSPRGWSRPHTDAEENGSGHAPGGSPQPEGGHRNGGNLHEQYVALESGSDDENEYQTAGSRPPELPQLENMQLDPERERVRAWAAAQITEPGPQTPHGAAVARCEGLARTQEGPDSDIEIDQEKKAAILGAMKNIQLNYIPPWALRITENDFEKEVKAAVRNKATPKN